MRIRPKISFAWTLFLLFAAEVAARAAEEAGEAGIPGELAFKWINLAIVLGGLGFLAWKFRLPGFFSSRAVTIRRELEEAARGFEESQKRLGEIERHLAQLNQEIDDIHRAATEELAGERARIRAAARAEAEKILAAGRAEIEATTRAAKVEMKAYAARVAVSLAAGQIREQMTPERQRTSVERFVSSLGTGSRG